MVSFGKGGSAKQSSQSTDEAIFPEQFINQYQGRFGNEPNPQYHGLNVNDPNVAAYTNAIQRYTIDPLTQAYNQAGKNTDEQLAQRGLATSPAQYAQGGAKDVLNRNYLQQVGQAGNAAAVQGMGLGETEATRQTAFGENQLSNYLK